MGDWLYHSAIESDRFGLRVARCRMDMVPPPTDEIVAQARVLGAEISILRFEASDRTRPAELAASGTRFVHADTLVYFACDLEGWKGAAPLAQVRPATIADEEALERVAVEGFSGYTSHYGASPCFAAAKVEAGYVDWALGHLRRAMPEEDTWLVEQNGVVAGFATCRRNSIGTDAEILLNAVLPTHQRRGLYRQLVAGLASAYRDAGVQRLSVSTQVWNNRVQRAWTALGFAPDRAYNTYHLGG